MDEKILLRVWPEFGSTGIWMPPNPSENVMGVMVTYETLKLPKKLIESFRMWQHKYDERPLPDDGTFDWVTFTHEGLELAKQLKDFGMYNITVQYWMNEQWQKIYGYMIMADYCASLWDDEGSSIGISNISDDLNGYPIDNIDELEEALSKWEEDFFKSLNNTLDWNDFNNEGNRLAKELQARLPDFCVVGYAHAFEETYPPL